MRHAIAAALLLGTAPLPAVAQEQPPTEQMDKAVPEIKSDTQEQQPPTKSVGEAVPEMKGTGGTGKMSQDDCQRTWKQANPSNAATINMTQAQPYVADFKTADPDKTVPSTRKSSCKRAALAG